MPQPPEPGPDRAGRVSDLVVFGAALVLYGLTLAPGLLPADSGEYQLIGARLGIAHPPGYALYTLASWLATQALFWLTPARAISALSAGLAAGALAVDAERQAMEQGIRAGIRLREHAERGDLGQFHHLRHRIQRTVGHAQRVELGCPVGAAFRLHDVG
ncbi:MAG TPA: DUF2723 domain-containing protein, partial [Anaerolineales bacterium]|nr:DUF2723 domain-containing protein [Anaerolineales bacterium]